MNRPIPETLYFATTTWRRLQCVSGHLLEPDTTSTDGLIRMTSDIDVARYWACHQALDDLEVAPQSRSIMKLFILHAQELKSHGYELEVIPNPNNDTPWVINVKCDKPIDLNKIHVNRISYPHEQPTSELLDRLYYKSLIASPKNRKSSIVYGQPRMA